MTESLRIALTHTPLPHGVNARPRLAGSLEQFGHEVTLMRNEMPAEGSCDVLWIQGNANWHPRVCEGLKRATPRGVCPLVVLWQTEPLPPPSASPFPRPRLHLREWAKILLRDRRATDPYTNARRLSRLMDEGLIDLLIVSTPSRQAFLAEHGIQAHLVPMGYDPSFGGDMRLAERDIDVLFLGSLDVPRRRRLISRLREAGVKVEAKGSWHEKETWGEARTELLNRTKIFLNIQRFPGELSGLRMILGMSNKTLVISEPTYLPGPYLPGTHWIAATIEQMPAVIAHYLKHEDERERIAQAGHDLVVNEITMEGSTRAVLRLIETAMKERRASRNSG